MNTSIEQSAASQESKRMEKRPVNAEQQAEQLLQETEAQREATIAALEQLFQVPGLTQNEHMQAESLRQELDQASDRLEALKKSGETPDAAAETRKPLSEAQRKKWEAFQQSVNEANEADRERIALQSIDELFFDMKDKTPFDTEDLRFLSRIAETSPSHRKQVVENLSNILSPAYAESLLDAKRQESLHALSQTLKGAYREGGPDLCRPLTLVELVAMQETVGQDPKALLEAIDFTQDIPNLAYAPDSKAVLQVSEYGFDKEGRLSSKIGLKFNYKTDKDEEATVERTLSLKPSEDPNQPAKKSMNHDLLKLPESLQGGKLGKKQLKRVLETYDKMDIDEITLHANIAIGAYAWATYGFEWDDEKMDESGKEAMIEGGVMTARMAMNDVGAWTEDFDDPNNPDNGYPTDEQERLALRQLKTSKTAAEIATAGKDGPFYCQDADRNWYRFTSRDEAKAKNDELRDAKKESDVMPGVLHMGKLALMGQGWYGKMPLKSADGSVPSSRKRLEKVLNAV